jgi:hypothetical protein
MIKEHYIEFHDKVIRKAINMYNVFSIVNTGEI